MPFPTNTANKPCKHGHGVNRDRSGRCRECHRLQEKLRYRDDPLAFMARRAARGRAPSQTVEARQKWNRDNAVKIILHGARLRAKKDGCVCTVKEKDITVPEFCPVFGVRLQRGVKRRTDASPSLDKIIPALGYTPGNVWVISWRANRIKNDATLQELEILVCKLREISKMPWEL